MSDDRNHPVIVSCLFRWCPHNLLHFSLYLALWFLIPHLSTLFLPKKAHGGETFLRTCMSLNVFLSFSHLIIVSSVNISRLENFPLKTLRGLLSCYFWETLSCWFLLSFIWVVYFFLPKSFLSFLYPQCSEFYEFRAGSWFSVVYLLHWIQTSPFNLKTNGLHSGEFSWQSLYSSFGCVNHM